jgi:hypothetical protein
VQTDRTKGSIFRFDALKSAVIWVHQLKVYNLFFLKKSAIYIFRRRARFSFPPPLCMRSAPTHFSIGLRIAWWPQSVGPSVRVAIYRPTRLYNIYRNRSDTIVVLFLQLNALSTYRLWMQHSPLNFVGNTPIPQKNCVLSTYIFDRSASMVRATARQVETMSLPTRVGYGFPTMPTSSLFEGSIWAF